MDRRAGPLTQDAFQRDLLARLGADPERARRDQQLVWALDFLSLAPLTGWVPGTIDAPARAGHPLARLCVETAGDMALTVDPWPFGDHELSIRYQGRWLSARSASQAELDERLAAAPWTTLAVTWRRRGVR